MEVSTITCSCKIDQNVDVISLGKYLECDDEIIGLKIVYSGNVKIVKGLAKPSKKKLDFPNQCTITLRADSKFIVSIKIFTSGIIHFTGVTSITQARIALKILIQKMQKVCGMRVIQLQNSVLLQSFDNLIFGSDGKVIGYKNSDTGLLKINGTAMEIDTFDNCFILQCVKWTENCKNIYTITGVKIGERRLHFSTIRKTKRNHQIEDGYVLQHGKIIGKEVITFDKNLYELEMEKASEFFTKKCILHEFSVLNTFSLQRIPQNFTIYMMNGYFEISKKFQNSELHKKFVENGYYSRFDPSISSAVNLRYHYNKESQFNGKCPKENKTKCGCKDISVLCFGSGKINVTGVDCVEQGNAVYNFMSSFLGPLTP